MGKTLEEHLKQTRPFPHYQHDRTEKQICHLVWQWLQELKEDFPDFFIDKLIERIETTVKETNR